MANSSLVSKIKQAIINEVANDELIVKTFGSPDYDKTDFGYSSDDIRDNYIFTWNQHPETITKTITFVTIQVNVYEHDNTFVKPTIIINLFTHNNHMKLNSKQFPGIVANRSDYLSQLLDSKLNGKSVFLNNSLKLIGKMNLIENSEGMATKDFCFRHMVFETLDVNDSLCEGE